jgi:periplasmic divalent cation tolerance protein
MLVVQTTCKSRKEAEKIGEALVRARIAACATAIPCRSIFRWKGKIGRQREWLLELKMPRANFPRAERGIKRLHSYELPQVIALPVARASRQYRKWVGENSR